MLGEVGLWEGCVGEDVEAFDVTETLASLKLQTTTTSWRCAGIQGVASYKLRVS